MTQSEALKLEAGMELDRFVACVVFGWRTHNDEPLPPPSQMVNWHQDGNEYGVWNHAPKFSTDISAAWEVVPKLREQWGSFCLATGDGDEWFCYDHDGIGSLHGIGPTPMVAICRAAIKAKWKA